MVSAYVGVAAPLTIQVCSGGSTPKVPVGKCAHCTAHQGGSKQVWSDAAAIQSKEEV